MLGYAGPLNEWRTNWAFDAVGNRITEDAVVGFYRGDDLECEICWVAGN